VRTQQAKLNEKKMQNQNEKEESGESGVTKDTGGEGFRGFSKQSS
jgi:hypothetical protein